MKNEKSKDELLLTQKWLMQLVTMIEFNPLRDSEYELLERVENSICETADEIREKRLDAPDATT